MKLPRRKLLQLAAGAVVFPAVPRLADLGTTVFPGSPADFGKFVAEETEKWGRVVKFAGAKPD